MSSHYQPRSRGPRPVQRGGYGTPRNQMSDPFSHFPAHYSAPVRYSNPSFAPPFMPAPGTVTTVWDPANYPSGAPQAPSVILHSSRNTRPFFTPLPTQKSVTFTADGQFVSSHSTLPLDRNDHNFPALPPRGMPYQPINQPTYQSNGPSTFSFTVPSSGTGGFLPNSHSTGMGPFQNPSHAHIDLTTMNLVNGGNFTLAPARPAWTQPQPQRMVTQNNILPPWNNAGNVRTVPQMYCVPSTPYTVLPFESNTSWQTNPVSDYGIPGNTLRSDMRGHTWTRSGGASPRSSEMLATDVRVLSEQVPYEQRGHQNCFFPGRVAGSLPVRPSPQFQLSLAVPRRNVFVRPMESSHSIPHIADQPGPSSSTGILPSPPSEVNIANMSAEELIERRMFREAAFNIIKYARQNDFPLEVIAYPLLCCGNSSLLEKYVNKQPEMQMRLLKLIETLHCDNRLNRSIVKEFSRDYCRPQVCGLNYLKLKKIATSWVHAFGVDPFEISSIYLDKCHAAIMYLIRNSTFEEISFDAWLENVDDLVKPFPDQLKAYTLNQLIFRKKDNEIMGRVMRLWAIDGWNGKMVDELLKIPNTVPNPGGVVKVAKPYYQCPLVRDAIEVVDSCEAFHDALTEFESESDCVLGIDCEWNSSRTGLEVAELALLQVATRSRCYLLDVFSLKQTLDVVDWRHLTAVFQNTSILKLGFDFGQDMQMMKPFLPGYNGGYHDNRIMDLKPLAELIADEYPDVFEGEKSAPENPEAELRFGLASLVDRVLGAPLSKLERMSNWEGRPMREAQIVYAATDAHCLIEIYDKLAENCEARGIPFPPKSIHVRTGSKKPTTDVARNGKKISDSQPDDSRNGSAVQSETPSAPDTSRLTNGVEKLDRTTDDGSRSEADGNLPENDSNSDVEQSS